MTNNNFLKTLLKELEIKSYHNVYNQFYQKFESIKDKLLYKIIKKDVEFFRARIGTQKLKGAIDDLNIDFRFSYFKEQISAPPPLLTKGGRFNREGISYLYLSSNTKTSISELRPEVNQICSVAKFITLENLNYLDLTSESEFELFNNLKTILLEPIHSEIKEKYLITQLLSDIVRDLGFDGIFYNSVQSDGINIVCFYPEKYKFINYSDQMIRITKVAYDFENEEPEYSEHNDNFKKNLSTYNTDEDDKKEKIFDYIFDKYNQDDNNKA